MSQHNGFEIKHCNSQCNSTQLKTPLHSHISPVPNLKAIMVLHEDECCCANIVLQCFIEHHHHTSDEDMYQSRNQHVHANKQSHTQPLPPLHHCSQTSQKNIDQSPFGPSVRENSELKDERSVRYPKVLHLCRPLSSHKQLHSNSTLNCKDWSTVTH